MVEITYARGSEVGTIRVLVGEIKQTLRNLGSVVVLHSRTV